MEEELTNNSKEEKDSESKKNSEVVSTSGQESTDKKMELNEILSSLKEHSILLNGIEKMIKDRLEYDGVKEKAFDKLYEEMMRQRETLDMLDRAVKPILSDLILLYDNMKRYELSLANKTIGQEETLQDFRYIIEELLEVLYRQEVLPIEENVSETFNSKVQKTVKIENTERKKDDFKIVSIVRSGFTWRDKILRPQEVIIKRFLTNE